MGELILLAESSQDTCKHLKYFDKNRIIYEIANILSALEDDFYVFAVQNGIRTMGSILGRAQTHSYFLSRALRLKNS